jgi:hypothetical protein
MRQFGLAVNLAADERQASGVMPPALTETRPGVAKIWRNSPAQLLALYLVLDVIALILLAIAHPALPLKAQPPWLPIAAFFAWRVSRGGRPSRVILMLLSTYSFIGAMSIGTHLWSPVILALLLIYAAQWALLVSPVIYQRTRRKAPGQAATMSTRWIPPLWIPLFALLAGLVVTLLYLGSMGWTAIPGCGPVGATTAQLPGKCFGMAQGYPVRFLTAYQDVAQINKAGLIEDWTQWSMVSFTIFYILRLIHTRPETSRDQPAIAEEPSVP